MCRGVPVPVFEVAHAQFPRQVLGVAVQGGAGFAVAAGDAAIDAEGQGHEAVAEEAAADLAQGQDADDGPFPFRHQEVGAMAEGLFDDALPAKAMKERGVGFLLDEGVPGGGIRVAGGAYGEGHGRAASSAA